MSDDYAKGPDEYERKLGTLDGLPGVQMTRPATVQDISLVSASTYTVRTVRQSGDGEDKTPAQFTTFLEVVARDRVIRVVLPPKVTELIARQRDALTAQARSKTAKRLAAERKARGIVTTISDATRAASLAARKRRAEAK